MRSLGYVYKSSIDILKMTLEHVNRIKGDITYQAPVDESRRR